MCFIDDADRHFACMGPVTGVRQECKEYCPALLFRLGAAISVGQHGLVLLEHRPRNQPDQTHHDTCNFQWPRPPLGMLAIWSFNDLLDSSTLDFSKRLATMATCHMHSSSWPMMLWVPVHTVTCAKLRAKHKGLLCEKCICIPMVR